MKSKYLNIKENAIAKNEDGDHIKILMNGQEVDERNKKEIELKIREMKRKVKLSNALKAKEEERRRHINENPYFSARSKSLKKVSRRKINKLL